MQIDQLVIDEGEAAIEAETPHPRAPLPDLPPVPGTASTGYCKINAALGMHSTLPTSALRTSLLSAYSGQSKQLVALARAGSQAVDCMT